MNGTEKPVPTEAEPLYSPAYSAELQRKADSDPLFSATMQEIADLFRVTRSTVCSWCANHPEFSETVGQIQESVNDRIAHRLYRAASGYPYQERKTVHDMDGKMIKEEISEKISPENVNAIRLWLINRNSREWKVRPEETASSTVVINLVNNIEEFR